MSIYPSENICHASEGSNLRPLLRVRVSLHLSVLDACIYDADEMKRVKYVVDHGHQVRSFYACHIGVTEITIRESRY